MEDPLQTFPSRRIVSVPLRKLAHGRSSSHRNRCCLSLIAWRAVFYPLLTRQVTEEAVAAQFGHRPSAVHRFLLPNVCAMNFVLDGILDGGANAALNLDPEGSSLIFVLLDMPIRLPSELLALSTSHGAAPAPSPRKPLPTLVDEIQPSRPKPSE